MSLTIDDSEEPAAEVGGLYDGFESYRPPTSAQIGRVFRDGVVALDANALVNLYRYTDQTRSDLLAALSRLGDRLWVPHQALEEFWRSRDNVLEDPRDTLAAIDDLQKHARDARNRFVSWARRVSLAQAAREQVEEELQRGFRAAFDAIESVADAEAAAAALHDAALDPVLCGLEPLLDGRVGPGLTEEALARALKEAARRAEARIPPGYRDRGKAKADDRWAAGDYLVWEQLLIEGERRGVDALLITDDVKDDWWRIERGRLRGPRVELAREMRERTGCDLYMLTPARFLELARELLGATVHEESVRAVERVGRRDTEPTVDVEQVERYWFDYLGESGRRLYRAAADVELRDGDGFTFDDLADELDESAEAARSYHRNSGRSARRWRRETGSDVPIRLDWVDYAHDAERDAMRTAYQLPLGVAEAIAGL